ncbi:MAG TPA: hypothetical protein VGI64_11915 [Streptosporangiaceae bacterium]
MTVRYRARHREPAGRTGGVRGNEQLTALTGAVLLAGFAAEGLTILSVRQLLFWHFFLGLLLLGPVTLKIASVCYRFARYYAGSRPYLRRGPPAPLLRVLGPLVISTSVAVLGTGVALAVAGPGSGPWLLLHKAAFIAWFCCMTVHVLAYAPRLPRLLVRGTRPATALTGTWMRLTATAAALGGGLLVAVLAVHTAGRWHA